MIELTMRDIALRRLGELESKRGIKVLLAVESGSRAWGFPSRDSDHDVRFLFVYPPARYLSVEPLVDSIEPENGSHPLDLGGWELRKALWLLCRGNATPIEWSTSPITYRPNPDLAAKVMALANQVSSRPALTYHYDRMARRAWAEAEIGELVPLKRYAYALRAALACRWLRILPSPAPMNLEALLSQPGLDGAVAGAAARLVARKAVGDETSLGPREPPIDLLIQSVLAEPAVRPERVAPGP